MKNILILRENKESFGGIEMMILHLARHLKQNNILSPFLVTYSANSRLALEFKNLGCQVYESPMDIKRGAKVVNALVRKYKINIIQSENFRESLIGRKVKKINPKITHIFRVHTYIQGSCIPFWRKYAYHLLDNYSHKYIDMYLPISQNVKTELVSKSHIPLSKVKVVYNGISAFGEKDLPVFSDQHLSKNIAIIGDLQVRKDQILAIQALKILSRKGIKLNMHLIGGNPENYLDKLKKEAKQLGVDNQVYFYGFLDQKAVYEVIKDIPVILLPSLFEGVPTCILEGMSLRKLVIATPVGGTCEVIKDNYNGLIFPSGDVQALAGLLENIISVPAKRWEEIRNNGYKTWQERFTTEKMMESLLKVYKELGGY